MPGRLAPLREDALEVLGVVRGEDDGVARQVLVPDPRQSEAERRCPHQGRHQPHLGGLERALGFVGGDEGCCAVLVEAARGEVDAPVVEGDGDVEEQGVDAGEVEVEHAAELIAVRSTNMTLSRKRSPWIAAPGRLAYADEAARWRW